MRTNQANAKHFIRNRNWGRRAHIGEPKVFEDFFDTCFGPFAATRLAVHRAQLGFWSSLRNHFWRGQSRNVSGLALSVWSSWLLVSWFWSHSLASELAPRQGWTIASQYPHRESDYGSDGSSAWNPWFQLSVWTWVAGIAGVNDMKMNVVKMNGKSGRNVMSEMSAMSEVAHQYWHSV